MSVPEFLQNLASMLGSGALVTDRAERTASVRTPFSPASQTPPFAVAFPQYTSQIPQILELCAQYSIPLRIMGNGTSLFPLPFPNTENWLLLRTINLNRIIDFSPANGTIRLQCGVTVKQLNDLLRKSGFFLPGLPDNPCATIGGVLAENSVSPSTLKYGTIAGRVVELEAALVDGRRLFLNGAWGLPSHGCPAIPFAHLFCGSLGAFACLLEATLRLLPQPNQSDYLIIQGSLDSLFQFLDRVKKDFPAPSFAELIDQYAAFRMGEQAFPALILAFAEPDCQLSRILDEIFRIARESSLEIRIKERIISPVRFFSELYGKNKFCALRKLSCPVDELFQMISSVDKICASSQGGYSFFAYPQIACAEFFIHAQTEDLLNKILAELLALQIVLSDTPDLEESLAANRENGRNSIGMAEFFMDLGQFFKASGILHNK